MFEGLFGKKEDFSFLVDIGNGSIAGAVACFSKTEKPKILYSTRRTFNIVDVPSNSKQLENMYALLDEILKDVVKNGITERRMISDALVSFSSPWVALETKNVNISHDKPFFITEAFVNDVIGKEEILFKKEFENNKENFLHTNSIKILDKTIISSRLNGYSIQNSMGKKTKNLDTSICLSAAPKIMVDKVCSIISKRTGVDEEKIKMHSFSLISFSVIRDLFVADNNFITIDISGETTDLTLVTDGTLIKNTSFFSGRNFIIRQIAKKFNVPYEVSESMFHLYSSEKINDQDKASIYDILTNIENEWAIYFEDALSELSSEMVLPSKVFLTADDDVAQFYSDCIKLPKTDSTSSFRKNVNIVHINKEILSHICKNDPRVNADEFLGLLAIFRSKQLL